jgi:hypothetical protein
MAVTSITQSEPSCQGEAESWEDTCYRLGCARARQEAEERLRALEQKLDQQRPREWQVEGWRERTVVTRFGEIRVRRRLYCDPGGVYHFALDEYLGWQEKQVATPGVTESVLRLAAQTPFRQVAQRLERLTAGVISAMTIHRLVQKVGQSALVREEEEWRACFQQGESVGRGQSAAEVLYTEADGVWVHLQREGEKHYEVKSGIAYTGWQRLKQRQERYALVGKRVYCQANPRIPFWEGASMEWAKAYDLSRLRRVVVGGDGANWIGEGAAVFSCGVRQLDGFHLARACGRAFGKGLGRQLSETVRDGKLAQARQLLAKAEPAINPGARKARGYVQRQLAQGVDWRNQVDQAPPGGWGLGTMESNGDKLVANRMKNRGISWTIRGAQHLAKVLQLNANDEVGLVCRGPWSQPATVPQKTKTTVAPPPGRYLQKGQWLQVTLPALTGPHASRPWAQALRTLAYPPHRLN